MSLHQYVLNIKSYGNAIYYFSKVLVLVTSLTFCFLFGDFVSKRDKNKHPIIIIQEEVGEKEVIFESEKLIFASKSGTKYYYSWCESISRVKEENKVWFANKETAIAKGYEKAKNCPGD